MIPHPPPIQNYEVKHSTTLRFVTNAAVSQVITFQNILDTILMITSATTAFDLFLAIKIRRIKIWSLPVLGQSNSVTVIFEGGATGFVGDRKVHQDSSMGIEPAFLDVSPGQDSLASKFQVSTATNAFFLEAPTGSVVDLMCTFRSDVQANVVSAQNAVVGGTTGAIGYRGLDGIASATSKFTIPTSFYSV
jgi:hypothetical protein